MLIKVQVFVEQRKWDLIPFEKRGEFLQFIEDERAQALSKACPETAQAIDVQFVKDKQKIKRLDLFFWH